MEQTFMYWMSNSVQWPEFFICISQFSRSVVSDSCDPVNHSTAVLPVHHQLPQFTQTHVHRVGNAIQPSHPLLSPSPPAPNPSQHQSLFQWVNCLCEVAKEFGVSASASILPMNTQDWSPLGWTGWISMQSKDSQESSPTPQFKSINFQRSAFFTVQLSHPYMTTGKTISLTRWTFVGKVISLLFNMLSRLVITFLPRSKHIPYQIFTTQHFNSFDLDFLNSLTDICTYWFIICINLFSINRKEIEPLWNALHLSSAFAVPSMDMIILLLVSQQSEVSRAWHLKPKLQSDSSTYPSIQQIPSCY